MTHTRLLPATTGGWIAAAAFALFLPSAAQAACSVWTLPSGVWCVMQSNGRYACWDLTQNGTNLSGSAESGQIRFGSVRGTAQGSLIGNVFTAIARWNDGKAGSYSGTIDDQGLLTGSTYEINPTTLQKVKPEIGATWTSEQQAPYTTYRATCQVASAPPVKPAQPAEAQKPVKKLGKQTIVLTAIDDVDIYNGPGGEYKVIGMMNANDKAPMLEHRGDWFKLQVNVPGGSGWVARDHLK